MRYVFEKIITLFFVIVLGALWFSTRKYEIPQPYKIAVYDKLGYRVWLSELRTTFNTHSAAVSFARQYSVMFPGYDFILEPRMHLLRRIGITTFRNYR